MLSSESHDATSDIPFGRGDSSDDGTDSLISTTGFISPRRETLNSAQTPTKTPKRTQTQKDSGFLTPQAGATKTSWDETEWLSSPPSPRSAKHSTRMFAHGEDSDKDEPANDTPVKLSRRRTEKSQSFGSSIDTVQPSKPTRKSSTAPPRYTTPIVDPGQDDTNQNEPPNTAVEILLTPAKSPARSPFDLEFMLSQFAAGKE